ncbi:MAG: hypothetical protein K2O67_01165, partial [Clostridia bacterium]|nr:hypothetical protein [Clostridia bacterium]
MLTVPKIKEVYYGDTNSKTAKLICEGCFWNTTFYDENGNTYTMGNPPTSGGTFTSYAPHEHTYQLTATLKAATCTTDGSAQYTCTVTECQKKKTETVPATGHKPGTANCSAPQVCTVCGETLAAAGEHTPGPAATCTEPQKCTVCQTQLAAAKGHTEVIDKAVDPTCTEKGQTAGKHCSACNAVITAQTEIPAKGHSWNDGEITKPATCTAEGVKTFTCSTCNSTRTETVNKIDHAISDWMTDKDPTCTAEGSKHKECTVCHTSLETGTIDKIAHTAGDAANCTTAQTCTECGFELAPKLGHNYEAVDGGTPPTCTTTGSGKVRCTRCNDEQIGASIPALGHIEVTDEAKAATCTETGLTEGKHCSRCNEVLTAQQEVPVLGHDWASTWNKDETNHWHICNRCDEKKDETAHTYDWVITKDPTEEETGEKEERCTVCEFANGNKETIAKLVKDPEGNGDIKDLPVLPPNQDYDLEIAVKESDSLYNIPGITKGYKVELFVVDGENRTEYDNSKKVTLMLVIPEGMEDEFTLYCRHGDILEPVD